MDPNILIIATTPYTESDSSRFFDSYFHFMKEQNLRQIFSRNWMPTKGHCSELYQITDAALLQRWKKKTDETGVIYHSEDLREDDQIEYMPENAVEHKMWKLGTRHTPFIEIARRALWRKKFWCTKQLVDWLDDFKPDCIFYNFSNHIFMQQIVLYVAERYGIPIIIAIGDDFYFNDQNSVSPLYRIYRRIFKRLTNKILQKKCAGAFCSDKTKKKYGEYFGIDGETIYFHSSVCRRKFHTINKSHPKIGYFGGIRLGRNHALQDIANALQCISSEYRLDIYSNETDETFYQELTNHPNVNYGGFIPYNEVQEKMAQCDILVVAEGFSPENINFTRYSLSTKAAGVLSSGSAILAYGPEDSGVIEYLKSTDAAMVCTDPDKLLHCIQMMITDDESNQKKNYDRAVYISEQNHTLESSTIRFQKILDSLLK